MERTQVEIVTEVEARKVNFEADAVWEMLRGARRVVVGRGRKFHAFAVEAASKEAILNEVLGRSGTLRAPTLKIGDGYYIGYNDAMYRELMT